MMVRGIGGGRVHLQSEQHEILPQLRAIARRCHRALLWRGVAFVVHGNCNVERW